MFLLHVSSGAQRLLDAHGGLRAALLTVGRIKELNSSEDFRKGSGFESFQEGGGSEKDVPYVCVQRANLVSLGSWAVGTSVVPCCHEPILQPRN